MSNKEATARPCEHNHGTNFNWETKAVYDDGQMLCWDCNQIYIPELLPQTYGSLVNERDALLAEVRNATERFESEHELLTKVVGERNRLRGEGDRLREALEPLVTRIEKMMMDGPECDCPVEGHLCGWTNLQREVEAARAALSGKEGEGNGG